MSKYSARFLSLLVIQGFLYGETLDPLTLKPSVINGVCSACGTTSCVNCPKSGGALQVGVSGQDTGKRCSACSDQGALCSDPSWAAFQQNEVERFTCRTHSERACCFGSWGPRTVYIPRSVGDNTARELIGWQEFIHQCAVGDYYLTTGHVGQYSRSFKPQSIARTLLGDCILRFAGSQVADRGACELLADNFGLSPYLRGLVSISPSIENIVFDNQLFIGLDPLYPGLYVRFHAPLVHTRWSLGLRQKIDTSLMGCQAFPAGALAQSSVPALCDIIQALEGGASTPVPRAFGNFYAGSRTKTGFADIDVILGCDFVQCEDYHCGLYGQVVIPCGNKPSARFLFAPVIGNGHHVAVGVGLSGHIIFWQRDSATFFGLYCEGNALHLCKSSQLRSFDFCAQGLLSRYMLLKEFIKEDTSYRNQGSVVNAIDITTRPVAVTIPIQGDISATLSLRSPCIIADIGYNFYGRSKEHLSLKKINDTRLFGVKGTEGVYALEYATVDGPPVRFGELLAEIALTSTQSRATAYHAAPTDNPSRIQAQNPSDIVVTAFSRQEGIIDGSDVMRAFSSNPPVLITAQDIHKASGIMPSQATHKFFAYVGYNFYDWDRCSNPYVGMGGEIEVDAFSCKFRTALNQYSVFVKGGFEF